MSKRILHQSEPVFTLIALHVDEYGGAAYDLMGVYPNADLARREVEEVEEGVLATTDSPLVWSQNWHGGMSAIRYWRSGDKVIYNITCAHVVAETYRDADEREARL